MERIIIDTLWDRVTRNDINTNFDYLFKGVGSLDQTIKDLIVEAGQSNPEVIQARGGESLLNDRLNKIDAEVADKANNENVIDALNAYYDLLDGKINDTNTKVNAIQDDVNHLRGLTVDDLPTQGIVSAHRGGGLYTRSPVAADNGFSGFDMAMRLGAHIIDVDARQTADGTFIAMHDSSVARTTDGRGFVTNLVSSALPNIDLVKYCGSGWLKESVPSIEEILIRYGGKVVITIEPKDGLPAIESLANLIKYHRLENSVFINTNDPEVAREIALQGCLSHVYGCNTVQKVNDAADAGAWMIEVPYDSSSQIVNAARNSSIERFIAGPIWTRSQMKEMSSGIQGHVTDALGMTNRVTGDKRLVDTIKGSLEANKRGIGWKYTGDWLVEDRKLVYKDYDYDEGASVYLGDMSGTLPASYSFNFKFIAGSFGSNTGIRSRICATIPDENAFDSTTDGYVCNLRGDGVMNLWTSSGNFGPGILLGETNVSENATTPLVEGIEYSVRVDITSTTIKMTREDTGQVIGPFQNTDWRGGNIYMWVTRGAFGTGITDVRITE